MWPVVLVLALLCGCGGASGSGGPSGFGGAAGSRGGGNMVGAGSGAGRHGRPLIGVMFDGPALGSALGGQLDLAARSGVESVRVTVDWTAAQPYRTFAEVPPGARARFADLGGVPTRFDALDRVVGAAAQRGLSVLPVGVFTPRWAAASPPGSPNSPPAPASYARFLTRLVQRYGPGGSFWRSHPGTRVVPVHMWQLWNEPNFDRYWSRQPFASSYVQLVAAGHAAIKQVDPTAQVVLAGFPEFSWKYLAEIYAVPGARAQFDVVAVHPYTARPMGVIEILKRVRAVMARSGDARKPLLATEITWPSSQGKAPPQFGVGTSERGQATLVNQVMPLLARDRVALGLSGLYWYTWVSEESTRSSSYAFDYAGLLKSVAGRVEPKPALAVFKRWALALQHCAGTDGSGARCG